MQTTKPTGPALPDIELPPTEDQLPYSDGMKMESERHVLQMYLLIEPLRLHWAGRQDRFVGGGIFVYFSTEQVRDHDFRGPDVFVALGVPKRERKSWVVWQEGKGPDVVIELLSESTAQLDKGEKKLVYQDRLRVPEYYWYDPFTGEFAGFRLRGRLYEPIRPDAAGRLVSESLDLTLTPWEGTYNDVTARWLRWATLEGVLLPTAAELAEQERAWAAAAERRIAELEAELTRYRQQAGDARD